MISPAFFFGFNVACPDTCTPAIVTSDFWLKKIKIKYFDNTFEIVLVLVW